MEVDDYGSSLRYTPTTEFDYGTLLCWGTNDVGQQRRPCIFHIVPTGPVKVGRTPDQASDKINRLRPMQLMVVLGVLISLCLVLLLVCFVLTLQRRRRRRGSRGPVLSSTILLDLNSLYTTSSMGNDDKNPDVIPQRGRLLTKKK
ncbi:hypothetical protein Pcinc_004335 [Petrolisthes cinctipes]|uniref:Uncharacterized protein n=1 Tax=Petrolisthes cinctipes TaxID=88211 RepID=A0AAE1GFI3_PETCI|nr:hypothetical protein Pcinc_004335 [Petrolisthes cinctipes]